MESCCIYICSVGPIEDCCVMLLLRFPPARKCLVGTFESFLCGFGEFCSNLHRSDSEGVTEWYQSPAVAIPHKSSLEDNLANGRSRVSKLFCKNGWIVLVRSDFT